MGKLANFVLDSSCYLEDFIEQGVFKQFVGLG